MNTPITGTSRHHNSAGCHRWTQGVTSTHCNRWTQVFIV